jgi:hypothetical protein
MPPSSRTPRPASDVLEPPATAACGVTDDERLEAGGAEVVQEPAKPPYGVRDCAFRDQTRPIRNREARTSEPHLA